MPYDAGVWRPTRWEDWELELIDASLDTVGLLDEAVGWALKWGLYGYGDGSFSIHIESTVAQELISAGNWYIRAYRNGCQIRDFMLAKDDRGYTVTSQYLDEYIMLNLVPLDQIFIGKFGYPNGGTDTLTTPNDHIDNNLKWMVDHVCGPNAYDGPGASSRVIAGLTIAANTDEHPTSQALDQGSGVDLYQFLQKYGVNWGVDWRVRLEKTGGIANQMVFETFYPSRGSDKTEGNGERSPIIINDASGEITSARRYRPAIGFANVVFSKDLQTEVKDAASIALYGRHEIQAQTDDTDALDMLLAARAQRIGFEFDFAESEMVHVGCDTSLDEIILNGNFETAGGVPPVFDDWTDVVSDGAVADEGVIVHGGSHSLKLTAGASTDTRSFQSFTVIPYKQYRLSLWVYGDGANESVISVRDITNGADIIAASGTGHSTAAWAQRVYYFVAPAGCVTARLRLWCPAVNGGITYFDDVSLLEDAAGTFMPGDEVTIASQYLYIPAENSQVQSIQFTLRVDGRETVGLTFGRYEKTLSNNIEESSGGGGLANDGTSPSPPELALYAELTRVPFTNTDPSYVTFESADLSVVITGDVPTNTIDLSAPGALLWSRDTSGDPFLYPTIPGDDVMVGADITLDASHGKITANSFYAEAAGDRIYMNGVQFTMESVLGASIDAGAGICRFKVGGGTIMEVTGTAFRASGDNTIDCGVSIRRWKEMHVMLGYFYDDLRIDASGASKGITAAVNTSGWLLAGNGSRYVPTDPSTLGVWGGYWKRTGTVLETVTAGDVVRSDAKFEMGSASDYLWLTGGNVTLNAAGSLIVQSGTGPIYLDAGGPHSWIISTAGVLYPNANNTFPIGTAGARASTIYGVAGNFSGDITIANGKGYIDTVTNTDGFVLRFNGTRGVPAALTAADIPSGVKLWTLTGDVLTTNPAGGKVSLTDTLTVTGADLEIYA